MTVNDTVQYDTQRKNNNSRFSLGLLAAGQVETLPAVQAETTAKGRVLSTVWEVFADPDQDRSDVVIFKDKGRTVRAPMNERRTLGSAVGNHVVNVLEKVAVHVGILAFRFGRSSSSSALLFAGRSRWDESLWKRLRHRELVATLRALETTALGLFGCRGHGRPWNGSNDLGGTLLGAYSSSSSRAERGRTHAVQEPRCN